MVLDHLTVVGNSAQDGNGIYTSGLAYLTASNCILRDVGRDEIYSESIFPDVTYSNIKGGWYGGSNIDVDPLFVDEAENDFHLRYDSPCRNAGGNDFVLTTEDFEGDPRIAYDIADMGVDEFYPHLYYTGNATPGGAIDLKFIGVPNETIRLWAGSGVLDPPLHHPLFGDWYLESPILLTLILGSIPSPGGVFFLPITIPSDYTSFEIPLQAGIGAQLSNLCSIATPN